MGYQVFMKVIQNYTYMYVLIVIDFTFNNLNFETRYVYFQNTIILFDYVCQNSYQFLENLTTKITKL